MIKIWKHETLTSDDLDLVILPGIGGRLWDVQFQGHSLLFQNPDLQGYIPNLKNLHGYPTQSPQFGFPLWGGEKTWIAPDTDWSDGAPYPTLDSGNYRITSQNAAQITLQSAICPQSHLQIERAIHLIDGSTFAIQHKVTNCGMHCRDVGVWSVMMLNHKTRIGVPGRSLRAAKVFGKPVGFVSTPNVGVICDCYRSCEFKVGIENQNARTFMRIDHNEERTWMCCETAPPTADNRFAHSYPVEVFNSGDYAYCEAEWHGSFQTLPQNATAEYTQRFTVWTDVVPLTLTKTEQELIKCMS